VSLHTDIVGGMFVQNNKTIIPARGCYCIFHALAFTTLEWFWTTDFTCFYYK